MTRYFKLYILFQSPNSLQIKILTKWFFDSHSLNSIDRSRGLLLTISEVVRSGVEFCFQIRHLLYDYKQYIGVAVHIFSSPAPFSSNWFLPNVFY